MCEYFYNNFIIVKGTHSRYMEALLSPTTLPSLSARNSSSVIRNFKIFLIWKLLQFWYFRIQIFILKCYKESIITIFIISLETP